MLTYVVHPDAQLPSLWFNLKTDYLVWKQELGYLTLDFYKTNELNTLTSRQIQQSWVNFPSLTTRDQDFINYIKALSLERVISSIRTMFKPDCRITKPKANKAIATWR
jgi:hypothetical protein